MFFLREPGTMLYVKVNDRTSLLQHRYRRLVDGASVYLICRMFIHSRREMWLTWKRRGNKREEVPAVPSSAQCVHEVRSEAFLAIFVAKNYDFERIRAHIVAAAVHCGTPNESWNDRVNLRVTSGSVTVEDGRDCDNNRDDVEND